MPEKTSSWHARPTIRLSLSAGYGSSYSNVRQKVLLNNDGSYTYVPYPFIKQYRDNASAYVSFGLSIPILNGMTTRNSVRMAKVQLQRSELALETVRKKYTATTERTRVTTEDIFEAVDGWLANFEVNMNEDNARIQRLKRRTVSMEEVYIYVGLLTALRVSHDSSGKLNGYRMKYSCYFCIEAKQ